MSMFTSENEIYDFVSGKCIEDEPELFTVSAPPDSPEKFPCMSISEINSYSDPFTQTARSTENYTVLIYEINVYSNQQVGKKAEAKRIAQLADKYMCDKEEGLGFRRTSQTRTPNIANPSVYRVTSRYYAKVRNSVVYSS